MITFAHQVKANKAFNELWRTLKDERPAFIEIRNHLLGTMLTSVVAEDDEVRAYLLDLGDSLSHLINAMDAFERAKRDAAHLAPERT